MSKIILVLTIILSVNFCLAQQTKGRVIYKKEYTDVMSSNKEFLNKNKNNPEFIKKVKDIDFNKSEIVSKLHFDLFFDNYISIFKVNDFLELETNKFYRFAIGPEGSIIYYTDQKNKQNIRQIDAYGELFLVGFSAPKWELSNESKKIGEYTCFKATAFNITKGRKGIIKTPIEAWYTPEVAIPFGPLGYNGLPGLIIELSMHNYKYFVSKIELYSKQKNIIKKPTQGKVVTKEEFEEIGLKAMSDLKKMF
jgi:GLPGLI family protein